MQVAVVVLGLVLSAQCILWAEASPARCELQLIGRPAGPGLASAKLYCKGGAVTVSVNSAMLGPPSKRFTGVALSECGGQGEDCLATFCTVHAVVNATVTGVAAPGVSQILCVAGTSQLDFVGSRFINNMGSPLSVLTHNAVVSVTDSLFAGNMVTTPGSRGGGLRLDHGRALV